MYLTRDSLNIGAGHACTRPCVMAKVEYLTGLFEAGQGNGHGACLATVSRPALAVSLVVVLTDV